MRPFEIAVSDVSGAEEFIIRAGAVAGALTAIGIFLVWVIQRLVIKPLDHKLAEHAAINRQEMEARLAMVAEDIGHQIAKVDSQLHANGGESLRDQTNRIEKALTAHITRSEEKLRILAIELNAGGRSQSSRVADAGTHHQNRRPS